MPTLSVTVIGLLGAVVTAVGARRISGGAVLRGLGGAWLGFGVGALVGVVIDVVTAGGTFVPVLGHAGAVAGTAIAHSRAGERRQARHT